MFRIPVAVILGAIFTTSVFWLLWHLVGRQVDVAQFKEATRIDFRGAIRPVADAYRRVVDFDQFRRRE